ncbi:MAG TPA: hypothetical protein PKE03_08970 [Bacteroidales bacterium]|nr:hypothetical protein [Bacteroidales bacterium]
MDYSIEYDVDEFSGNYIDYGLMLPSNYPINSNYANFNRMNAGLINGFGVEFKKDWFVG